MKCFGSKKGFSLLETILAVAILAACFLGLSYVMARMSLKNMDIDRATTAVLLANEVMEKTMAKDFANVASVAQTAFAGSYSAYSYQVTAGYVNPADLTTIVAGPTEYKRVQVNVTAAPDWSGSITLFNLRTNQ